MREWARSRETVAVPFTFFVFIGKKTVWVSPWGWGFQERAPTGCPSSQAIGNNNAWLVPGTPRYNRPETEALEPED